MSEDDWQLLFVLFAPVPVLITVIVTLVALSLLGVIPWSEWL